MIDTKTDACEDFYRHACGHWLDTFKKPADHSSWSNSFSQIEKGVRKTSVDILNGTTTIKADEVAPVLMTKLKNFYNACNDVELINKQGMEPVKKFVHGYIGQVKDLDSFMMVLAQLGSRGLDTLFSFGIDVDEKHPTATVPALGQGGLGLPDHTYYTKKQYLVTRKKYLPLIQNALLSVWHVDASKPTLKRDARKSAVQLQTEMQQREKAAMSAAAQGAKEVLAFETALAHITVDRTQLRDPIKTYHKYPQAKLFEMAPVLAAYFAHRGDLKGKLDGYELHTSTPTFFAALSKLLKKTPVHTLKTYLTWHLTKSMSGAMPDAQSQPYFTFYGTELSGVKQRTPRWKRCYGSAGGHLSDILSRAFIAKSFTGDSKKKAQALIGMIKAAFKDTLSSVDWLDEETRRLALIKLAAVVDMVGYPDADEWHDYKNAIVGHDHLANLLALSKLSNDRNLAKLGKPVDKREWGMAATEVNAYYSPESNRIVFPAAILQPPFFSAKQPMSMNFGAIGMVMGHELTHGFDDTGRKYDKNGALKSWWKGDTPKRFDKRAQCTAKQYSSFKLPKASPTDPDQFVNGKLTLGEDLADNGGTKQSFNAYSQWAAKQKGGMAGQRIGKYSGAQLFFYSMAQAWCTIQDPKAERLQSVTDPHPPSQFRINGVAQNSADFAKTFNCKVGSKMNPGPGKRCVVWGVDKK